MALQVSSGDLLTGSQQFCLPCSGLAPCWPHLLKNGSTDANSPALRQGRPQGPPLAPIAHAQLLLWYGQPLLQQAHDVGHPARSTHPI